MNKDLAEAIKRNLSVEVMNTGCNSFVVKLILCGEIISEDGCQLTDPYNP